MTIVNISEMGGVRNLHFGSRWVQGAMRIAQPYAIELHYVQSMMLWVLFNPDPRHIVQLGLGAASLTKFCYWQFLRAHITAVELNPAVISICATAFVLPPNNARLSVVEMDAMNFVLDPANEAGADVIQVDLYDADAQRPALDTPEFYAACAKCLGPDGLMIVNLLGENAQIAQSLCAIENAFEAVAWLAPTPDGNVIAIAFKKAPQIDFDQLYERAALVESQLRLPARSWVDGLQAWMQGE